MVLTTDIGTKCTKLNSVILEKECSIKKKKCMEPRPFLKLFDYDDRRLF